MLLSPPVFSTLKIVPPKQIQTLGDDVDISKKLFTSVEQEREIPTNVKEPMVVKRSMRLPKANKVSKKCHTIAVRKRKRDGKNVRKSVRGHAVGGEGSKSVSDEYLSGISTADE